jgi:NTE family protein
MPGTDTLIQGALERRNLLALFGALPLLRDLPAAFLADISQAVEWFSLPGGTTLFTAGEQADGAYVVINGALGVYTPSAEGGSLLAGQVAGGQIIGETELLLGQKRTATLIAMRDTEVARLPTAVFERLMKQNPLAMREVAAGLARRLEGAPSSPYRKSGLRSRTCAIVTFSQREAGQRFAESVLTSLRTLGRAELVTRSQAEDKTSHWFHRLELAHDYVLYVTDPRPGNWTNLCLRQAEAVVLVGDADSATEPFEALRAGYAEQFKLRTLELVLLHRAGRPASSASRWMDLFPAARLHHVWVGSDIARVARILAGRATGLVLSGGGARGFAHIGVMRAMQEARLPVDAIGGTSVGSIIGAGWASGWDYREMVKRIRRTFVDSSPTGDYTWPLLSLLSGRRVGARLQKEFGDINIEDLPLPFFCVSTNLTRGQAAVHRRGRLRTWLRASISIPGVLPPVILDGQIYVDGATINNLPVDVMREFLAGTIIAADVGSDHSFESDVELTETPRLWQLRQWLKLRRSRINIMQVLLRAGMVNSAATTIGQRELADVLLKLPTDGVNLLDWGSFEHVVELGYRYTSEALEQSARLHAHPSG